MEETGMYRVTFASRNGDVYSDVMSEVQMRTSTSEIVEAVPIYKEDDALENNDELIASGAKYEPKGVRVNRKCPVCTCELTIEAGYPPSWLEPGMESTVQCEHCGHSEVPVEADFDLLIKDEN
jgi:hypothetical protein